MRIHHLLVLAATLLAVSSCERKQTAGEKVRDKVNDALDRRPGEKVRDAAEDIKDAVEDASKEVKKAVKDITK